MELTRKKNQATRIVFPLINSSSRPDYYTGSLTSPTVSGVSWQDGQAAAGLSIAGSPSYIDFGLWELGLTAGEMNPDSGNDDYIALVIDADEVDEQTVLIQLQDYDSKDELATEANATSNKDEILSSGVNWTTADVSALATEANATANKEEILASGDLYWQTGEAATLTSSGIWNYTERTLTDPDSYKADVSGLATEANATANKDEILASGANWVSYSPAEIATDIFGYNIDGKTASGLFQVLLAYAQGNIQVTGNLFTYYAQDDATSLWVTEISGTTRTRQ